MVLSGIIVICSLVISLSYLMAKIDGKQVNYDVEVSQLKKRNDSLLNEVKLNDEKIKEFQVKIDSISLIKSKVQIKYIQKRNEIENSSAINLVSEFDSIFTNAHSPQ